MPEPLNDVSSIPTVPIVTLPLFVTRYEYVTVSPTADTVVGDADFAKVNAGAGTAGVVTVDVGDVTGTPPAVPVAVAVFVVEPLSISV